MKNTAQQTLFIYLFFYLHLKNSVQQWLTLFMLENILALDVNIMPADALASKVARAAAGMVLAV